MRFRRGYLVPLGAWLLILVVAYASLAIGFGNPYVFDGVAAFFGSASSSPSPDTTVVP